MTTLKIQFQLSCEPRVVIVFVLHCTQNSIPSSFHCLCVLGYTKKKNEIHDLHLTTSLDEAPFVARGSTRLGSQLSRYSGSRRTTDLKSACNLGETLLIKAKHSRWEYSFWLLLANHRPYTVLCLRFSPSGPPKGRSWGCFGDKQHEAVIVAG